ncbi:MAG: hypothetical protein KAG66_24750, partial [Methylococcales bacterium]|nr:hypothetical protein [Methylococcales bacterium]
MAHKDASKAKQDAKRWLSDKMPDKADGGRLLGFLTLRQMVEIGSKHLPGLGVYMDTVQNMLTRRNVLAEESGVFAEKWRKWTIKHRAASIKTYDIMHRATLAGVDPAEAYQALKIKFPSYMVGRHNVGGDVEADVSLELMTKIKRQRNKSAKGGGVSIEVRTQYAKVLEQLRQRIGQERARLKAKDAIYQDYAALPKAAKAIYVEARDMYVRRSEQMERAVISKIERLKTDDNTRRAILSKIRQEFEQARVEGPYFPLQRYGEYFASVTRQIKGKETTDHTPKRRDYYDSEKSAGIAARQDQFIGRDVAAIQIDGKGWVLREKFEDRKFLMYESQKERRADLEKLEAAGWSVNKQGVKSQIVKSIQGTSE